MPVPPKPGLRLLNNAVSEKATMQAEKMTFMLFVAGNESNSSLARANLRHICETYLEQPCEINEIDVFGDFQAALDHRVLVTDRHRLVC